MVRRPSRAPRQENALQIDATHVSRVLVYSTRAHRHDGDLVRLSSPGNLDSKPVLVDTGLLGDLMQRQKRKKSGPCYRHRRHFR